LLPPRRVSQSVCEGPPVMRQRDRALAPSATPGHLGHEPGGVLVHGARCLAAEGRQLRLVIAGVTLTRLHGHRRRNLRTARLLLSGSSAGRQAAARITPRTDRTELPGPCGRRAAVSLIPV